MPALWTPWLLGRPEKQTAPASCHCCHKGPQTGGLKQQWCVLYSLEVRGLRSSCWQGQFLRDSQGESVPGFCQRLVAAGCPRLMAASLQAAPIITQLLPCVSTSQVSAACVLKDNHL